jgi:hypothetical protein
VNLHELAKLPVVRNVVDLLRTPTGWFIAVFLAVQLVLPLHYYLLRRDPHDERFAWRMFSPIRIAKCTPEVNLDGRRLDLQAEFHEAWVHLAERGRFGVLEAMGAELCRRHTGSVVQVTNHCEYVDGGREDWGGYNICDVPLLYGE